MFSIAFDAPTSLCLFLLCIKFGHMMVKLAKRRFKFGVRTSVYHNTLSPLKLSLCFYGISTGFIQLRENLEKGLFLKKIREKLEKSGNFLTIFTTSGKTRGILFCQISLIK